MTEVRDTSLKAYDEIQEEGIYDSRMEEVLNAIREVPLMTGREYATIVLGYDDMNIVRPRITDLKTAGYIIEFGKRKCSCSGRSAYIWATLEGVEINLLKKLGFLEKQKNLYYIFENGVMLYMDFRKGKRRSYAFDSGNDKANFRELDIYKKFKNELNEYLNNGRED